MQTGGGSAEQGHAFEKQLSRTGKKLGFSPAEMGMAPLDLQVLVPDEPVPVDLFLPIYKESTEQVEMELGCAGGEPFLEKWRDSLFKKGVRRVFVRVEDASLLTEYFGRNAARVIDNGRSSIRKKAETIRELATLGLRLTFTSDLSPRALESCVEMADTMVSRVVADPQVLSHLADALGTDFSIYTHSVNVSMIAMAFAKNIKLSESQVYCLGMGGLLHDLGMARIPHEIVNKDGSLSDKERKVVETHPRQGYDMLRPVGSVSYDCLMSVLHHHENADGSGYPAALAGSDIPASARIMRLVDSFVAITSKRPYRDKRSNYEAASTLLQETKKNYDPTFVTRFIKFLGGDKDK